MERLGHRLQFIADTTEKNIHLEELKDKTAYEVLKVLLDQLEQAPNIRLNEKIILKYKAYDFAILLNL